MTQTGNLPTILHILNGVKVMFTTNLDVADGLANGATGRVIDIIKNV